MTLSASSPQPQKKKQHVEDAEEVGSCLEFLRHQVHTRRWPWRLYPDIHAVRRQSVQREAMERWDGTRLKNSDTVQLRARVRRPGAEMVPKPLVSGRGAPPRPGIGAAIGGGEGRGEVWSGNFSASGCVIATGESTCDDRRLGEGIARFAERICIAVGHQYHCLERSGLSSWQSFLTDANRPRAQRSSLMDGITALLLFSRPSRRRT